MSRRYKGRGAVESTTWCIEDAAGRLAVFRCWCRKMLVVGDVGAVPRHEGDGVDGEMMKV